MEKFISWVVTSSADPNRASLFIKGVLLSIAPIAMLVLGITDADFNVLVEAIVNVVFYVITALSAIWTLYGLARKLWLKRWSAVE